MTSDKICVEIIIPLRYNDGRPIEISKHRQTKDEIINKFGGCSFLTTSEGAWKDYSENDRIYMDINTVCLVDVDHTDGNVNFFRNYVRELEERYQQRKYVSLGIQLMRSCNIPVPLQLTNGHYYRRH